MHAQRIIQTPDSGSGASSPPCAFSCSGATGKLIGISFMGHPDSGLPGIGSRDSGSRWALVARSYRLSSRLKARGRAEIISFLQTRQDTVEQFVGFKTARGWHLFLKREVACRSSAQLVSIALSVWMERRSRWRLPACTPSSITNSTS